MQIIGHWLWFAVGALQSQHTQHRCINYTFFLKGTCLQLVVCALQLLFISWCRHGEIK